MSEKKQKRATLPKPIPDVLLVSCSATGLLAGSNWRCVTSGEARAFERTSNVSLREIRLVSSTKLVPDPSQTSRFPPLLLCRTSESPLAGCGTSLQLFPIFFRFS